MAVYRFRVLFEEYDDVHRDIEIRSSQTFEQFHHAIQQAIGFDASKPASFFMSNDNWKKGQEITIGKGDESGSNGRLFMKDSRLCDFIADPHQKIYYVFDQPSQWTFFIELYKIFPDGDPAKDYPTCVKVHGEAPKQYLKIEALKGLPDPDFVDEDIFTEILTDDEEGDQEDTDSVVASETGFGDGVDEEEYDNIEEPTDGEIERD